MTCINRPISLIQCKYCPRTFATDRSYKMHRRWHYPNFGVSIREKCRLAKLGDKNPNYGKHLSLETRMKMSAVRTGRPIPEEVRFKSSMAQRGKKHPTWRSLRICSISGCCNKHFGRNLCQSHYMRKYFPAAGSNSYPELTGAMINVRIRDGNACQWYDCSNDWQNSVIHIHHIFPRSEYPELELIEQYMICYCADHHLLWHYYRGDIAATNFLGGIEKLLV